MDQKDVETLNLKDPDKAWAILTPTPHLTDYPVDDLRACTRYMLHNVGILRFRDPVCLAERKY
jgi:hypothetical protein